MGARSPRLGVGLGHEGDHQPDLLGDLLRHEAQQGDPVRRDECRREVEVELDLPVATLVVEAERPETALPHGPDHRVEEVHHVEGRLDVVAGGRAQRARTAGYGTRYSSAGPGLRADEGLHHVQLRLDPELEHVARRRRLAQSAS